MLLATENRCTKDIILSKNKGRKTRRDERLDWSLVESKSQDLSEKASSPALARSAFFVIATPVRFWMLEFKLHASYLSYKPLPCPYAMSISIKGLRFGAATKSEVKSATDPQEWFVFTPTKVWKCREIYRNNFVPGLQRAWLSAFLAAHDIFPAFEGLCCMVKPQSRGRKDKPRFSLAIGMQRYRQDLAGALRQPRNQNARFFRLVFEKCIRLIKKLSSPHVGCLYTDYKPSNFVVDFDAEQPLEMDMRLIDAEPNFTFVVAEGTDTEAQRHLLQANLFFWYVNFWSLAESVEMVRARHLEYRRALRTAVEPYFSESPSERRDGGFRRLLVNMLLDSSKYNLYSPLSILHKYFFWRMEQRDLTDKVKTRMRLLLATWPPEAQQEMASVDFAGKRRGGFNRRAWMFRMVEEVLWCTCFPAA